MEQILKEFNTCKGMVDAVTERANGSLIVDDIKTTFGYYPPPDKLDGENREQYRARLKKERQAKCKV